MNLYLAGGVTGNLSPLFAGLAGSGIKDWVFEECMKLYLAGSGIKDWVFEECMKLYLAGSESRAEWLFKYKDFLDTYILESFYSLDNTVIELLPEFKDVLIDSGAFTWMNGSGNTSVNFQEYATKYATFIKEKKIKHYFELDVDCIIGYEKVKELRKQIEDITGSPVIPVWHKKRGLDEFYKMCEDYKYVAIGGIVTKEITNDDYKYFPQLIDIAHKAGSKIHGLGFTRTSLLKKYHFDSVDSTAWTTGNRFGYVYIFSNGKLNKVAVPKGKRLEARKGAVQNFLAWAQYSRWAETHL